MSTPPDKLAAAQLDFFGPGAVFHHVGLVVPDIDAACPGLQKFIDPRQDVAVAFVDLYGEIIEFIEPGSPRSPVSQNLAKGIKLAHLCYAVPHMQQAIDHAARHGFRLIARPVPAVAFSQRRIAWLFHPTFGLFELLEKEPAR